MNPAETSLLPRVLLGAAVGLAASSAAAAPVAFDPADLTVAYTGNAANGNIYFDPQTGYVGTTQAEGTSGLNADFRLYLNNSAAKVTILSLSNGSQASQTAYNASTNYAPRFSAGTGINGGSSAYGTNFSINLHDSGAGPYPWNPGDRGYLALGITANAATGGAAAGTQLYGWAEVSYNADQSVTLYRLGYDNAGGTSIAGAVPEPGSLSAAAVLGAAGLLAYRRRRAAVAVTADAQA